MIRIIFMMSSIAHFECVARTDPSSKAIAYSTMVAKKVAVTYTTVLFLGTTGNGKEVFAQTNHQASKRSSNHFVAINCSAFSKALLESEMPRHKAEAFTGAIKDTKGFLKKQIQE